MKIEKDKRKKNIICLYNACGVSSKCVEDSAFHLTQNTATLTPFWFCFFCPERDCREYHTASTLLLCWNVRQAVLWVSFWSNLTGSNFREHINTGGSVVFSLILRKLTWRRLGATGLQRTLWLKNMLWLQCPIPHDVHCVDVFFFYHVSNSRTVTWIKKCHQILHPYRGK